MLLKHGWLSQPALLGGGQQLVVGYAAPQKERESRRELEVADRVDGIGRQTGGILLNPHEEGRAHEEAPQAFLDARVEATCLATVFVESQQRLHIGVGHRPAIGQPGQCREDLPGARGLLRRALWTTDVDAPTTGCLAWCCTEGAVDRQTCDGWLAIGKIAQHGVASQIGWPQVFELSRRALQKRRPDSARASLHRDPDLQTGILGDSALARRYLLVPLVAVTPAARLLPADGEKLQPFAVERE